MNSDSRSSDLKSDVSDTWTDRGRERGRCEEREREIKKTSIEWRRRREGALEKKTVVGSDARDCMTW